jgi:uncharacterized protein YdaU (DUF1376 family)
MYYYQHHIGDYRKDTTHLSILEHGAYRQLLDLYYISEQPLPLDDAKLMRLVCARNADEVQAVKNVLDDFFEKTKDGYIQSRCDKEIITYHGKSLKAKASADARWNKNKDLQDANALPTQSERNANHKPLTNNHKPTKYIPPIPAELLSDFMVIRKSKRLGSLTETAFNGIQREADKAGLTVIQVIQLCCERGWGSFKADWEWQDKPSKQQKRDDDLNWFLGNQVAIEKDVTHG